MRPSGVPCVLLACPGVVRGGVRWRAEIVEQQGVALPFKYALVRETAPVPTITYACE